MTSQSKLIFYISIFSLIVAGAFITPASAWQNVFCNIALFGTNDKILCEGLRDTITFKEGSGVDIELDTVNQIVTFSSSSSGDGNTAQIADAGSGLGWFSSRYNATLNYLKSLSCGTNLTCISNATTISISATGTGEANTMSNIGTGQGEIYKQKTGVNFEVRTLLAGAGMSILTNANEILLSVSALTSANNVGSGELAFIAYNNSKVNIKRLDCDSTLNCFNGTDSNTIGVASISQAQVVNLVSDLQSKFSSITNVGSGTIKLVKTNTAPNAQIKTITTTQGITLLNGTDEANISTNFKIDNLTPVNKIWPVGFTNSSGDWSTRTFALNNGTSYCGSGNVMKGIQIGNTTGYWGIFCVPDQSGGTTRAYLAASWDSSSTKTNIGAAFVNIYTQTNSDGKSMYIDTNGFTQVRMTVNWNKVGGGTQTVQVVDAAGGNVLISLDVVSGFNDSGLVSIPAAYSSNVKKVILQGKSTTAGDDPVFEGAAIYLR